MSSAKDIFKANKRAMNKLILFTFSISIKASFLFELFDY